MVIYETALSTGMPRWADRLALLGIDIKLLGVEYVLIGIARLARRTNQFAALFLGLGQGVIAHVSAIDIELARGVIVMLGLCF